MTEQITFSVFIPTLNERDNIVELIERLEKYSTLKNIIIIDDDSSDGTPEQVEGLKTKYPNIILKIRKKLPPGRGLSGREAYQTYLDLNDDSNMLIEMDADLSHNPDYIQAFLKEYAKGAKVIVGSRYINGGSETGRSYIRRILSKFAHLIIRNILSIKLKDPTAGFRAFDKNVLKMINFSNFISQGPEIVEEMYFALSLKNIQIKEIPIVFPDRVKGDSKLNFIKLFRVFLNFFRIATNNRKDYFISNNVDAKM